MENRDKPATVSDMQEEPQPIEPVTTDRRPYAWLAFIGLVVTGIFGAWAFDRWMVAPTKNVEQNIASTGDRSPMINATTTQKTVTLTDQAATTSTPTVAHVALPDEVRGIYWTSYTAAGKRGDDLLAYAVSSHLNTIVIDVKLDNGELAFIPEDPALKPNAPKNPAIKDLDALLERLRTKGIYRIARLFVFRDQAFGKLHPNLMLKNGDGSIWRDNTGTAWLDPAAPEVADYTIAVAREAYNRGFDEVQFDYVRFPTDGRLSAIRYPVYDGKQTKVAVMKTFFQRVGEALKKEGVPMSFDLFGMTFWTLNDFQIGQRLPDTYPFAVAISPMVYPSHYPNGFQGFANPAQHPYEIVKQSLDKGIETMKLANPLVDPKEARKKFRPWIQDFNLGATYDRTKIEAQIKASRDAGASGWMLWNAANRYTNATYVIKK